MSIGSIIPRATVMRERRARGDPVSRRAKPRESGPSGGGSAATRLAAATRGAMIVSALSLTDEQRATFARDGLLILRGLVPADRVRAARAAIAEALERDESTGKMLSYLCDTFCPDATEHPAILALLDPLRPPIADLFGTGEAPRLDTSQIAIRFPQIARTDARHGFHLDGFPNALNGVPAGEIFRFTILGGVYLTPLRGPDRGNLVVWPGSHRFYERWFRERDVARELRERGAEAILRDVRAEDPGPELQLEVEPGDAILAHHLLAHGAADNLSMRVREAVYFRIIHPAHDPRDPSTLSDAARFYDGVRW